MDEFKLIPPILEFDDSQRALIEPGDHFEKIAPCKICVLTFFQDVIDQELQEGNLTLFYKLKSTAGIHPIYLTSTLNRQVAVVHPMLGGPYAAGILEELIALGFTTFIACGGAGSLIEENEVGQIIIVDEAIRQERTSYHYLPPSRSVLLHPLGVHSIETVLKKENISCHVGKTWTTDAIYRETKNTIHKRKQEGCLTVEMECASFAAVAQFRGVYFGQMLYCGDDVSRQVWNSRGWITRKEIRRSIYEWSKQAVIEFQKLIVNEEGVE